MAEILIDYKDKQEADELVSGFLRNLTLGEQKEFLAFMKGFQLAKGFEMLLVDKQKQTSKQIASYQTGQKQCNQMSIFDLDEQNKQNRRMG